jgi:hypothetical protein
VAAIARRRASTGRLAGSRTGSDHNVDQIVDGHTEANVLVDGLGENLLVHPGRVRCDRCGRNDEPDW